MTAKRLMAVAREIATVCGGKHPPMDFVHGWFDTAKDDHRLQEWVIDNTDYDIDGTFENTGIDLIDKAIERADGTPR
jgi:hypothetical protein